MASVRPALKQHNIHIHNNNGNNKADHGIAAAPLNEYMPPSIEAWLNGKPTMSVCDRGNGHTLSMTGRWALLPSNMAMLTGIVASAVFN